MYVPELRTQWEEKNYHVQLYGDKRDTAVRDPPDLKTRPKKAADGIESNRSSTIVTGSQREKSTRVEESLDLKCGFFSSFFKYIGSNEMIGRMVVFGRGGPDRVIDSHECESRAQTLNFDLRSNFGCIDLDSRQLLIGCTQQIRKAQRVSLSSLPVACSLLCPRRHSIPRLLLVKWLLSRN